ncbi:MAG TPA: cupin domain-containing protein [Cyclobacteriaceae bacterium]|nr:cupin domain-containing protein [Cyclobacteriaceae bacterium]
MKILMSIAVACLSFQLVAQNIDERIIPNDPSKYRELNAVHAGAGSMGFTELVGRQDLTSNFLYLHAGKINAKSGIGHHFHHSIEEMFVILDGEAEFTINGRTSTIKAPAVVPCKMGSSHAIYNAGTEPITWLNFAVSTVKARGDAFDLGDTREGAVKDEIPVFVSGRLGTDKLRENFGDFKGTEIKYRRVFGPEVFATDWNYVDHVLVPAGASMPQKNSGQEEQVYYVIKGAGSLTLDGSTTSIASHQAFYVRLNEDITLSNTGDSDLEVLVVGINAAKNVKSNADEAAMVLQMDFVVDASQAEAFEKMYHSVYVPAMTVQQGYLGSKLLKLFPERVAKEIEAEPTTYNYQIQISFDTEENRRRWVASKQHDIAWPAATDLAKEYKWRGYDLKGTDERR